MKPDELAQRTLSRLNTDGVEEIDLATLTDEELEAIINTPPSAEDTRRVRYVSKGRTSLLNELTDEELQRIIDGIPYT